jgi:N-dimethylarginine dimethylaminohydrolase
VEILAARAASLVYKIDSLLGHNNPMDHSEFSRAPAKILLHDPRDGNALGLVTQQHLSGANFIDLPTAAAFFAEYKEFRSALAEHVEVVSLQNILADDPDYHREAETNPNLMFTRDSTITLPWAPDLFIPARLALPGRRGEAEIVGRALQRLGLKPAFEFVHDEFCEGGDVLPAMDKGKRILLVGFGVRTTKAAAIRLALELIPTHVDQIIGLSHDPDLLHLDTGFTILPNRVIFAAAGMFHSGFLIDEERRISSVDPIAHAEALGFTIVRCDKADAIAHERCNMLPLGNGRHLAFSMPDGLRRELERKAGITIACLSGLEIAKAAGGVHCLTRPIYA